MNRLAGRWPTPTLRPGGQVLLPGRAAAVRVTAAALVMAWVCLPPVASAQVPQQARAKPTVQAKSSAATTPTTAAARRAPAKVAAPKTPVARTNVAVGAAAVAAAPAAYLSHGCLDATHGRWLSDELGPVAVAEWPMPAAAKVSAVAALADLPSGFDGALPEATSVQPGGQPAAGASSVAAPAPAAAPAADRCVPFASVRTPGRRIESLALVPKALSPAWTEAPRAVVVSRAESAAQPVTSWHELDELPALRPESHTEVWVTVAAVLAGEASELPTRWQREVTLLVRQMKRQPDADRAAWARLVMSGEGEAARPAAVELVDERGAAVDSAIWVDRTELPGGFVSALGGDYERMLWQSPVDYRRISRGVGSATVIVRKRVFAQPKTPGGKPRLVVRSFRSRGQHLGIDFAAPSGTPVVTVADGTVVHAGTNGGYGNLVVVDHGGGVTTSYAHLSAYGAGVQEGAKVERGQEIGLVGSTGMSTGPHLHFEIRKDGKYLDPADPKQTLPNWSLAPEDHEAVLTRLLTLSLSRPDEFSRAARSSAVAAAQATAAR
jgi:murein DD-endopeptidase MepM/ murein hydrolase activator NlpD